MRLILDGLELILIFATIFTAAIIMPLLMFRLMGVLLGAI